MNFIKEFSQITSKDLNLVGGKNASLGEMINNLDKLGIRIPDGFAITAEAYLYHLKENNLLEDLKTILKKLTDHKDIALLHKVGQESRSLILSKPLPEVIVKQIEDAYKKLSQKYNENEIDVAIRSSATAEDLPTASFAGQQDSYLNIKGTDEIIKTVQRCMASLFTDRAISYRIEKGFDHFKVAISVGVQKMIRSDEASSGIIFTLDTETGFKDVIVITSSYGLGESIVQGLVNPDEFHIHKKTLELGYKPIIKKSLGSKEIKIIYTNNKEEPVKSIETTDNEKNNFSLSDDEILLLATQSLAIEKHYSLIKGSPVAMDIEWAKDGIDKELYIVQARPETIHTNNQIDKLIQYNLKAQNNLKILATGQSIGRKIVSGTARIFKSISDLTIFNDGDILITGMTDPDWVPLMKKAGAIITDRGGRTCHAAIVSRELGIPSIVGTSSGTKDIKNNMEITVDCSQGSTGFIYEGKIPYEIKTIELAKIPKPKAQINLNIGDPDQAYQYTFLPVSGVGLARIEFIISNTIKIHPMAAAEPQKIKSLEVIKEINQLSRAYKDWTAFFIDTLAQSIGRIAAAFYPKPVMVRLSDFKTNEYRNLLGGNNFEPFEENPMLGFRGAVRYCSKNYAPAFALECEALKKAIYEFGLTNIKILVPFVRTPYEASCTIAALEKNGLSQKNNLEIHMMCEIPSNIILMEEFGKHFDGFSIGSNDLTQFILAIDRDSEMLQMFDERDPAVKEALRYAIKKSHEIKKPIGICGQAPSDFIEIAELLIESDIDSISLNADSVIPFLSRKY